VAMSMIFLHSDTKLVSLVLTDFKSDGRVMKFSLCPNCEEECPVQQFYLDINWSVSSVRRRPRNSNFVVSGRCGMIFQWLPGVWGGRETFKEPPHESQATGNSANYTTSSSSPLKQKVIEDDLASFRRVRVYNGGYGNLKVMIRDTISEEIENTSLSPQEAGRACAGHGVAVSAAKHREPLDSSPWPVQCPRCTFPNHPASSSCEMCGVSLLDNEAVFRGVGGAAASLIRVLEVAAEDIS